MIGGQSGTRKGIHLRVSRGGLAAVWEDCTVEKKDPTVYALLDERTTGVINSHSNLAQAPKAPPHFGVALLTKAALHTSTSRLYGTK